MSTRIPLAMSFQSHPFVPFGTNGRRALAHDAQLWTIEPATI